MNQFTYNMIMNVKDLNFAMDTMYKRTNYLKKVVKRHGRHLFVGIVVTACLLYKHDKEIKKLNKELDILRDRLSTPIDDSAPDPDYDENFLDEE